MSVAHTQEHVRDSTSLNMSGPSFSEVSPLSTTNYTLCHSPLSPGFSLLEVTSPTIGHLMVALPACQAPPQQTAHEWVTVPLPESVFSFFCCQTYLVKEEKAST